VYLVGSVKFECSRSSFYDLELSEPSFVGTNTRTKPFAKFKTKIETMNIITHMLGSLGKQVFF